MKARDYYITGVFRVLKRLNKLGKEQDNHQNELLNSIKHT